MKKKQAELEIVDDLPLLSASAKKWLAQNKANEKKGLALVSGKNLISVISYSHISSTECFIDFMGTTKRIRPINRLERNPEECLLELLVCRGIQTFDYKTVRKPHTSMIDELKKAGIVEYTENWKFRVTAHGRKMIKRKTRRVPKKKIVSRKEKCRQPARGKETNRITQKKRRELRKITGPAKAKFSRARFAKKFL